MDPFRVLQKKRENGTKFTFDFLFYAFIYAALIQGSASVMRIRIDLIHQNQSDGLPGGAKVGTKNGAYHTLCFSTRVFLTAEIFSPHVPKCNVCGDMLLSSHITLTFLITPQIFCLMDKTNCLTAPNCNDMTSKFQKDAMGNSQCN